MSGLTPAYQYYQHPLSTSISTLHAEPQPPFIHGHGHSLSTAKAIVYLSLGPLWLPMFCISTWDMIKKHSIETIMLSLVPEIMSYIDLTHERTKQHGYAPTRHFLVNNV